MCLIQYLNTWKAATCTKIKNISQDLLVLVYVIRIILSLFLTTFACSGWCQQDLAIGQWKSYLPYEYGWSVTQSSNAIYYGTQWALLKINKEDLSLEYFSKVEGLSDIGIQALTFDEELQLLLVVYTNSNIDLIFEDRIINLNQIKTNTQIVEDRTVHDIYVASPFAYLATGFGVVQLDLEKREFGSTTFTSSPVLSVERLGDYLTISTESGLYQIDENAGLNLADFGNWTKLGFFNGLPENHQGQKMELVNGELFAGVNDELYRTQGQQFSSMHREVGYTFQFAVGVSEGVLTGWACNSGCNSKQILLQPDGTKRHIVNCSTKPLDALVDEQQRIWYADQGRDYRYSLGLDGECIRLNPDRPPSQNASQMAAFDGHLYVATGGVTLTYGYLFRTEGFYTNESGSWMSFNNRNVPQFEALDMRDFLSIEASDDGTIYIGTFWKGLIEYKNGAFTLFNEENSSLQNSVINPDFNRVTDLAFDDEGNLWMVNHDAPEPISVYTKDKEWMSFAIPTATNTTHIAIDNFGYKWISVGGVGVVVFDSGDDLLSSGDDRYRLINANNSEMSVNTVNALATDHSGGMWVGTSEGPVHFNCLPLEPDCRGTLHTVIQNGIPGRLLDKENIKDIAIDGANQKWFGTDNGVFVQSADIETQLHGFNERNSPLFDNGIIDIEIDPHTGEVFMATNKGIQSYRGAATEGGALHQAEVTVFPNPVRPDYHGTIAIRGLAENALVKITDVNGQLVHESDAKGGQAVWDGDNLDGVRVASGVYLVYATALQTFGSPDVVVAKVMIIN